MSIKNHFRMSLAVSLFLLVAISVAHAQYSGGSGTADDPYQIARAEDLIALGETWRNLGEHYVLTADIDLDPNLAGRRVFDRAVIGHNWMPPFSGVFDGDGHTIAHLTIIAQGDHLGLFGVLAAGAEVRNLGLADVNITGSGNSSSVGGLAGLNEGIVTTCHSTGAVEGNEDVGGLVGSNLGVLTASFSTGTVTGDSTAGGLVGSNWGGIVTTCHSTGTVEGNKRVGGLVGSNLGVLTASFSTGTVTGDSTVGGLVGRNTGDIRYCYSTGEVSRGRIRGGLVGSNTGGFVIACYSTGTVRRDSPRPVPDDLSAAGLIGDDGHFGMVTESFWDIETSGVVTSAGGIGLTTAQMRMAETFLQWGGCGSESIWTIDEGNDYPRLWWEEKSGTPITMPVAIGLSDVLSGVGTEEDPYLIYTAEDLAALTLAPCDWDKHFRLMGDIDLSGYAYDRALIAPHTGPRLGNEIFDFRWWSAFWGTPFTGVFDGNGHTISHLTIVRGEDYLGLFGQLESGAEVKNLGVVDVNITGSGNSVYVGGVAGANGGAITGCYSTGMVSGAQYVGGLVGGACEDDGVRLGCSEGARVVAAYSAATVTGTRFVGGLIGSNENIVTTSFSTGEVIGKKSVGGLVGGNSGGIATSYGTGAVRGTRSVGGLVGSNGGSVATCYSTGLVIGDARVGGLVGDNQNSIVTSFWDVGSSGLIKSDGGVGLTAVEMQTASTFLHAGWDFIDETENGTEDIWWILEGEDYPRLWWELDDEDVIEWR